MCINEADLGERGHQVSQMHQIYSPGGASQVLVWLGEERDARQALEFCSKGSRCEIWATAMGKYVMAFRKFIKSVDKALGILLPVAVNNYKNTERSCNSVKHGVV